MLHAQLAVLWARPYLARAKPGHLTLPRGRFNFLPLVLVESGLCHLELLLLRRGEPGVIQSGGDIDNRVKTLLDALRVPAESEIPKGAQPTGDEAQHFFCLLEDDALVTRVTLEADMLLERSTPATESHVVMAVHVTTKTKPGWYE